MENKDGVNKQVLARNEESHISRSHHTNAKKNVYTNKAVMHKEKEAGGVKCVGG